ncbi:hypothetical protein [Gelidibacter sp. F63206]|uniref:hypothetical protein n=1 Tax=Gelidibacter sp. F63206 TaxID=2926425 RepID=UPI001FF3815A|nr:hypothetical protein [Gelidibacter sp. F63206]MCK0115033.1 hypothetical protein [Gelidibacter sp. F63206]
MIIIKIILLLVFAFIFYQDHKDREVYWFLFPCVGIFAGYLFLSETLAELFYTSITTNLVVISILILIVMLYSKLKLKTEMINTIGLGDLLMFFFLSFTFSTVSFMVILVSSLLFSLLLHLSLKKQSKHNTVPLAGYMGLFFSLSYLAFWSGIIDSLYSI